MSESSERAREEAQRILADRRFHETELPRPLRGPLEWLGERLEPLGKAIGDLVDKLPGDGGVAWLILALGALLLAAAVASRLVQDRGPRPARRTGGPRAEPAPDASTLEREAEAAELAGELERALRLRFQAGVLRLVERRQIDDPSSVTTGALVRRLRSEAFAAGARSFDEVVYGRRAPTRDDVQEVRDGWQAVLAR